MMHEIVLNGYTAHNSNSRCLHFGTAESYGIEQIHITPGADWENLLIKATFHPPSGDSVVVLLGEDGVIDVPPEATAVAAGEYNPSLIVFSGISDGVQRISADIAYTVLGHAPVDGKDSEPTPSQWEQLAAQYQSKLDKQQGAENAGKVLGIGEDGMVVLVEQTGGDTKAGVTFTPAVSEYGLISWTNDGDLPNPDPVNIKGPAGKDGDNYVLTDADKQEIAQEAAKLVEVPESGSGSGLTIAQIYALDGMFKIAAYTEDATSAYEAFRDAFGLKIPATAITLSVSTLSFTDTASKIITATVEPKDSTDVVVWTSSNSDVATVANGVVSPVGNGNCTITATAGSVSASCGITVEFEAEVTTYTITNNLTNCASNNNAASIVEGGSYTATLTADEGYTLDGASVSVVVNGEDITDTAYSDGVITIPSVMGNVVITAVAMEENAGDSDEVVMLKNISFDGTSYLDTEVIPESVSYRYVIGIQAPNKDVMSVFKNIGGISMRNQTNPSESSYWEIYWGAQNRGNNYNADVPNFTFVQHCMGLTSTVSAGQDKGDGLSSQPYDYPMYYNCDNGAQSVWLNEDCTETPVAGHFASLKQTVDFTNQSYYTDDEHPIDSIWLGKVHVTGIMGNLATEANTYAGMKFYCFKVYDADETLIADMHPAKQGSTVGMWDNVRNKFYPATGTANYEEVSA